MTAPISTSAKLFDTVGNSLGYLGLIWLRYIPYAPKRVMLTPVLLSSQYLGCFNGEIIGLPNSYYLIIVCKFIFTTRFRIQRLHYHSQLTGGVLFVLLLVGHSKSTVEVEY